MQHYYKAVKVIKIPVRQLGLKTGKVVIVRRVKRIPVQEA